MSIYIDVTESWRLALKNKVWMKERIMGAQTVRNWGSTREVEVNYREECLSDCEEDIKMKKASDNWTKNGVYIYVYIPFVRGLGRYITEWGIVEVLNTYAKGYWQPLCCNLTRYWVLVPKTFFLSCRYSRMRKSITVTTPGMSELNANTSCLSRTPLWETNSIPKAKGRSPCRRYQGIWIDYKYAINKCIVNFHSSVGMIGSLLVNDWIQIPMTTW